MRGCIVIAIVTLACGAAQADHRRGSTQGSSADAEPEPAGCLERLDRLGVAYESVHRRGIEEAVEVNGPIGGIEFRAYKEGVPLVLDCSLVYSLVRAGRYLSAHGVSAVRYSSAYDRRNIRGTRRPSKHSFGLAIDIHTFIVGEDAYTVKEDYEQGLGDDFDCIGEPVTEAGRLLRTLDCQLSRSELFRIVLTPDYDADHYNHFHIEALAWDDRTDLFEGPATGASPAAP